MKHFFRRAFSKPSKAKPLHFSDAEYPVNPYENGVGSNAAGVFIDGVCYTLAGEPPARMSTVHGIGH